MRIVVDTSVVVSGLLTPRGAPGFVLQLIVEGAADLLYDDRILEEYAEVLRRPRLRLDRNEVTEFLSAVRGVGEVVAVGSLVIPLDDSDDQMFAEVAVAGVANALVTGNARHFGKLSAQWRKLVVTPRQFFERCRAATLAQRCSAAGTRSLAPGR